MTLESSLVSCGVEANRSNWGQKSGQERILAVALSELAVDKGVVGCQPTPLLRSVRFRSQEDFSEHFSRAQVSCAVGSRAVSAAVRPSVWQHSGRAKPGLIIRE